MRGSPQPGADPLSVAYWQGAARGLLVLQQCGQCGRVRHYPQVLCGLCQSADVRLVEADPGGTVLSWTVTKHAFHPSVADQVPYVLVTVDMNAGVRILGRFRGSTELHPGLLVRLAFEPGPGGRPIPVFSPVLG